MNLKEQITKLEDQISFYREIAWFLVLVGFGGFIFGCAVLLWASLPCTDSMGSERPFLTKLSETGGYFQGVVGSFWALAGFMFVYVAFLGQRLQLVKQEEESEMQQKNFASQQKSILLQQFENSFFQLLTLQKEIVSSVHDKNDHFGYATGGEPKIEHVIGRHLFQNWYGILYNRLEAKESQSSMIKLLFPEQTQEQTPERTLQIKLGWAKDIYANQLYRYYQGELGHYFRNLYHVFKFVDTCELLKADDDKDPEKDSKRTIKNKRRYTSIVRAQLSQYELALLFYNGISVYGEEKFKPLIEKYGLLENFNPDDLVDMEHMSFYNGSALRIWMSESIKISITSRFSRKTRPVHQAEYN